MIIGMLGGGWEHGDFIFSFIRCISIIIGNALYKFSEV